MAKTKPASTASDLSETTTPPVPDTPASEIAELQRVNGLLLGVVRQCLPFVDLLASREFETFVMQHLVSPTAQDVLGHVTTAQTTIETVRTTLVEAGLDVPVPSLLASAAATSQRMMGLVA